MSAENINNAETQRTQSNAEWKVYRMNECDWWVARSLDEAKEDALMTYGNDPDMVEDARELTEEELDRLQYCDNEDDLYSDAPDPARTRSFREQLKRLVEEEGLKRPEQFASTEF